MHARRGMHNGPVDDDDERTSLWLAALEKRHLADLTASEVGRALRALSSCYVERRTKLAAGGALDSAGKRAAFALFYAPLHFLVTREVVRALDAGSPALTHVTDLGCGTGAAGAAWAMECRPRRITIKGTDRNAWAIAEANWVYGQLGLAGRAGLGDVGRTPLLGARGSGILAAYTINELPDDTRAALIPRLLDAHRGGACILVVEPIARRMMGWWSEWERVILDAGGRTHEWRFPAVLPERQRQLGRAAGLDPRELTARTLWLPAAG